MEGRDIGWAEMVAVLLALGILVVARMHQNHFIIHSDNSGICGSFVAGCARNSAQNDILQRIVDLLQDHDITFTVEWISTVDNLADAPSQGCLLPICELCRHRPPRPFFLKKLVENLVRAETWAQYVIPN
jgi:hypothetical protein